MAFQTGLLSLIFCVATYCSIAGAAERPNILIITVDDMNCDSVGAFGAELAGTTPNVDRLASEGLRFKHAHVQVGNCMPSRNVMFSGMYPHNNRVEGFYQVRDPGYRVMADYFSDAGYLVAIRGKVSHSTPYHPYPGWTVVLDDVIDQPHPKRVESYYEATKAGIERSREAGKPFNLLINISDPHKPFYGVNGRGVPVDDPHVPSRTFSADEVPVPGFLPDDPVVREELAEYYSTVRRADDCVGATLRALEEAGQADSTLVMFYSDHGMPLPFAKTAVYHHSTRTPWIVRWPGVTEPGTVDSTHMISAIDLLPTLLEVTGIERPSHLEGRSFLPLLKGESQAGRDFVIKEYNENAGRNRQPMRAVETRRYLYIFNPWSDGERLVRTATQGTKTYRRMKELAKQDRSIAARLELFDHRVVEEFYDVQNDPDARNNLIDSPNHQQQIATLRQQLEEWMEESGDFALEALLHRHDPAFLAAFMEEQDLIGEAHRRSNRKPKNAPRREEGLITFQLPKSVEAGSAITVEIEHDLRREHGKQKLHVTLKRGKAGTRVERKVVTIRGRGMERLWFDVPDDLAGDFIQVAAFVGEDYPTHLEHINKGPIAVGEKELQGPEPGSP